MTSITKSNIVETVHQNFYTLINAITGITGNLYPAFPSKDLDAAISKDSYPVFVLNSPNINSWDNHTLTKVKVTGTISVEIYTNNAKDADYYATDIFDKIETSIRTIRGDGLIFVKLDGMDKNVYQREKINIHMKTVTFSFEFIFSRSALPW